MWLPEPQAVVRRPAQRQSERSPALVDTGPSEAVREACTQAAVRQTFDKEARELHYAFRMG